MSMNNACGENASFEIDWTSVSLAIENLVLSKLVLDLLSMSIINQANGDARQFK